MTAQQQTSMRLKGTPKSMPVPVPAPVMLAHPRVGCAYARFVKPVLDRVGAALLLLITLPVILLVCLAVYLLGRPIFFRQPRVGRDGTTFGMLKFRTMEPDRRRRQAPVPASKDRRRQHKSADDPRHTDLGRILRRCSLDESRGFRQARRQVPHCRHHLPGAQLRTREARGAVAQDGRQRSRCPAQGPR